jgi:peptidoglycan/LPS O-acetylase OafA/YrhL
MHKYIDNFDSHKEYLGVAYYLVIFSNIFLFGQDILMFLGLNGNYLAFSSSFSNVEMPLHKFILVGQAWALSLELYFYVLITLSIPILFNITKNNSIDGYIGELSYPIYISHMFIIYFTHQFTSGTLFGISTVFLSIIFSILLIKFVQNPLEKYRQQRFRDMRIN